jgi:hypothetical protein
VSIRHSLSVFVIFILFCDRPKFYFVKVDVQACYDTIKQEKLLQIVEALLVEVRIFFWL